MRGCQWRFPGGEGFRDPRRGSSDLSGDGETGVGLSGSAPGGLACRGSEARGPSRPPGAEPRPVPAAAARPRAGDGPGAAREPRVGTPWTGNAEERAGAGRAAGLVASPPRGASLGPRWCLRPSEPPTSSSVEGRRGPRRSVERLGTVSGPGGKGPSSAGLSRPVDPLHLVGPSFPSPNLLLSSH